MLGQVSIDNQNNETRVEELTKECTFNNSCFLLTDSVLTNPTNEGHHNFLQDCVDRNNNDCDREGEDLGEKFIVEILQTNLLSESRFTVAIFKLIPFFLRVL